MEDPSIQELLELMLPPQDGYRPHITSRFASTSRPSGSTNPHRGLDANYYLGPKTNPQSGLNLAHPTIQSPVAGDIEEIEPSLGRIVIRERDSAGNYTGYRVEILHTNTRSVRKQDRVDARQPIGTMGGVGVKGKGQPEGFQHMHVQVIDPAGNVVNPFRHLFEYHHPGEPMPPLPQFEPQQLGPRTQRSAASQPGNQEQLAPSDAQPSQGLAQPAVPVSPPQNGGPKPRSQPDAAAPPARSPRLPPSRPGIGPPLDITPRLAPGAANPGAAGPAPAPDGLPPLHFAPETPHRFRPFEVPGLFQSDAVGSPPVAPLADGTPTNPSIPPAPSVGASSTSSPATSPAPSGMAGQIGDGNGIGHWWNGLVADVDAVGRRNGFGGLSIPMPNNVPTPPTQTVFHRGLPGMLQRAGAFDPSASGLLGLLQEIQRNRPDDDGSA